MPSFDVANLIWPALAIFVATLFVSFHVLRSPIFSLFAAFIKSGIFLLYFGYAFDGTYTFLDDWSYLEGGKELLANDVGVTNLTEHWGLVLAVGGGDHFAYYLYNAYAFRLFGVGYYAPVALNILLTVVVSWIGTRLVQNELALPRVTAKLFFAFLLLHPDIFAWSNVMNGKDVLVLLLHVLLLCAASLFFKSRIRAALMLAVPVSVVLLFLRFYVPVLFSMALMACLVTGRGAKGRLQLLIIGSLVLAAAAIGLGESGFQYAVLAVRENFVNPFYGLVRMVLTPIPFNADEAYSFLDIPALIHWLLIPFVVLGGIRVYRYRTQFSRFFLAYALIFLGLYAVFGELQGPRHRVQLDYVWAVLQFMGLMVFLRAAVGQSPRHVQIAHQGAGAR